MLTALRAARLPDCRSMQLGRAASNYFDVTWTACAYGTCRAQRYTAHAEARLDVRDVRPINGNGAGMRSETKNGC